MDNFSVMVNKRPQSQSTDANIVDKCNSKRTSSAMRTSRAASPKNLPEDFISFDYEPEQPGINGSRPSSSTKYSPRQKDKYDDVAVFKGEQFGKLITKLGILLRNDQPATAQNGSETPCLDVPVSENDLSQPQSEKYVEYCNRIDETPCQIIDIYDPQPSEEKEQEPQQENADDRLENLIIDLLPPTNFGKTQEISYENLDMLSSSQESVVTNQAFEDVDDFEPDNNDELDQSCGDNCVETVTHQMPDLRLSVKLNQKSKMLGSVEVIPKSCNRSLKRYGLSIVYSVLFLTLFMAFTWPRMECF